MALPDRLPPSALLAPPATPVLLYDGACGLCAGSVQFVLAREPAHRRGALRFAPLGGAFARTVQEQHPELAGVDSVLWVEPAPTGVRVRVRSDAALAALAHLGGRWRLLAAGLRLVPAALRDAAYAVIARHRLALVAPRCLVPAAADRERFLP